MVHTPIGTLQEEAPKPVNTVDTYAEWQREEGIPVVTGFYVEDVGDLDLAPWPRKGGRGAFVNLEGTGGVNDAQVVELAPGGQSEPERHLYEETIYVVSGRGSTSVWYEGGRKQTFEWGPGSLFGIPLNSTYQLFNGSGTMPARYMAVTNAPVVMNLFHNWRFVFEVPYRFDDRLLDAEGYFNGNGVLHQKRIWETNFVADTRSLPLQTWKERGGGGTNVMLELAQSSMGAHISQFPVGTYKKAHRHGPGAHVIILDGVGFSLLWKDGDAERKRCDWRPGGLVVPPDSWFHEHFNTGAEPARYLALRPTSLRFFQPMSDLAKGWNADVSVKEGGWQIEYEDEDPSIHASFEAELAEHGAVCRMQGLVPGCTGQEREPA